MKEITDEYIISLIDKYRDVLIAELESSMCLDCYNLVRGLNLTENDVELRDSVCNMCKKQKNCIKHME